MTPYDGPPDFAAERLDADAAALRAGIGPESRGLMGEDIPSRDEADADAW